MKITYNSCSRNKILKTLQNKGKDFFIYKFS